jgi:hypothetical protein
MIGSLISRDQSADFLTSVVIDYNFYQACCNNLVTDACGRVKGIGVDILQAC